MAVGDILLSIPFNEVDGTTQAVDSSGKYVANLIASRFVPGRFTGHNAAYFAKSGRAEVLTNKTTPFLPASGIYSFCVWLKAEQLVSPSGTGTPTASWVLVKFAGRERFLYLDLKNSLTSWNYFALVMEATQVSVYLNARLIETRAFPTSWGKPTGWCILNDNPNNGAGFSTLEDLTIYDGVADIQLLTPPIALMDVTYLVNGVDFKTYGVYVSDSDGIIDNLTMKEPFSVQWDDHHGEVLDLSRPRYEAREITLSCFIQGVGKDEFLDRVQGFIGQFQRAGTQRLRVVAHSSKPLVYEVYLKDSISLKKKWSDSLMVGTFEIKLREPQPVKRVLKFGGSGSGAGVNLFNKAAVVDGREVQSPSGVIAVRADDTVSEYIPVQATTAYNISGMQVNSSSSRNAVIFAADKTTVLQLFTVSAGQSGRAFTTPANAAYVVFTMTGRNAGLKNYDTVKFELGGVATAYTPYGAGVTITLSSSKVLDIFWGDGTNTKNVYGTNVTVSHTYTDAGAAERYVIIAGVIEDITAFTTNATVLWSKL